MWCKGRVVGGVFEKRVRRAKRRQGEGAPRGQERLPHGRAGARGRTSWVGDGLDVVDQLQIREVVHVDFVLQHNDDPVGNGSGRKAKRETDLIRLCARCWTPLSGRTYPSGA